MELPVNPYTEQRLFRAIMRVCLGIVVGTLCLIIVVTLYRGGSALLADPSAIITAPSPRYLLGGEGGFLHAILGSFIIVFPATAIATVLSLSTALYLQSDYSDERFARMVNTFLNILWGTPSIAYGVFILTVLIFAGGRASLLAGIVVLTLLEFPIITRYVDEAFRSAPTAVKESTYALGATRFETATIVVKTALPGVTAGVIMGLARGFGDAASLIFTAGGGISMPSGLSDPATTLPILIFQQAASPYPSVRNDAYAASFVLIVIVLMLILTSKLLARRFSRFTPGRKQ